MPCLLNTNAPRISLLSGLGTNGAALNLAASSLGGTTEQTRQGIAGIESILVAQPPGANAIAAEWSSLAATAALSLGDFPHAAQLAGTALKFNPDDVQAAFLLRILAREAPAPVQK